ncbi:type VI secretion system tube protein Hcp [Marinobacterium sp. YM272]|uniref:type VI secretion system tube protein Hcp n=1 Tax=Marinobacterium sp. YM272 TaxID=3421654 RepID=UPI003D7FFE61
MNTTYLRSILLPLGLALLATFSLPSQAYQLMQIQGIPGDAQEPGYRNWIRIDSISANILNGECSQIVIAKRFDSTSLPLIMAASSGMIIEEILIANLENTAGEKPIETFRVQLSPASIETVSLSGADSLQESLSIMTENLTFNPGPEEYIVPCNKRIK